MSHSHTNGATNLSSTHSHNTNSLVNNIGVTSERSEILTWLSPIEPRIRHQGIRARRADNVGEWLLETDEFRRWCGDAQQDGSENATLFCYGDPGVGKTYFSSLVVDRLCDMARDRDIAVACFYVDFAAREEQSPVNILGSLLKQIVGGLEMVPGEISRAFQEHKKVVGGRGPRVAEIVKMLQVATLLRPTFICADALDECAEGDRPEVLTSLGEILKKSPNTRIFLTGSRHIGGEIKRHLGGGPATLAMKPSNGDIVGYIRMRLSKDTSLDAMDDGLEAEIIKGIAENIPKTYLLISATMDAILEETSAHGRRQRHRAMTNGLDLKGIYSATLERIKEQGGEKTRLGMAALLWISQSERPLKLDELSHALAVEMESTDLNLERIPSVGALLSSCLGLVVVDWEASTVRLIHSTLQEYLYTRTDLFGPAHSIMAETCLTYLNFRTIKEISPASPTLPQSTAFLNYSSLYWGVHARREISKNAVSLALQLFSQIESHISTKLLLADLISRTGRYSGDIPINGFLTGFTGLHCASVFGIVDIATALMGQPNCNLNKRDFLGITPLIWATICGQERVARFLLEQKATIPDKPDNFFRRTPLSWAACKGYEGIVTLFLGPESTKPGGTDGWWGVKPRLMTTVLGMRYVNPNRLDKYGQTPISLAAEEGHEGVVKVLLGSKDIKPDVADEYGHTPLFWACGKGHEKVVKLLVEHGDVNINRPNISGKTPLLLAVCGEYEGVVDLLLGKTDINHILGKDCQKLLSWAAQEGHDAVIKLLLGRQYVNLNMCDTNGRTPLSWAAGNGHDGVVRLLLGRQDVNPNRRDENGQTPLLWASINGCDEVVKLLLGREDVDPNMPDNKGQTPFFCAAETCHYGAAKLLLGRKGINPNMCDSNGRVPLFWAAKNGRDEVAKILLGREDVSPNMRDNNDRTPLSWAAGNGCNGIVKLLLGLEGVNPDMPDINGQTPLSWAVGSGHDEVVKLLLRRGDVHPNIRDNDGRNPLYRAAGKGRDGVVNLLLGREDINPDMPDNNGQTPLSCAAGSGHDGVVELLLRCGDVNPNIRDKNGRTPLSWAAGRGRDGVVNLLLGREDINPDIPDNNGQTPLLWAAEIGHRGVVKLLLGSEDVDPNMRDNYGLTPLSWAAGNGRDGVMKLLLGQEDISTGIPDYWGKTPLSWAAETGHYGAVKLLLGRGDIDPDTRGSDGRTPLSWAAGNGRDRVVNLLLWRKGVNPNMYDNDGRTPLSWAAGNGRDGATHLLLGRQGVNPDMRDNNGRAPLSWAAENGHDEVVKLLLERADANANIPDKFGKPPILRAARSGHESIVKLLEAHRRTNLGTA